MRGENRMLTTEVGLLAHGVVGEGLNVALGVVCAPRHVRGDLAPTFPLGDGAFQQLALLWGHLEAGDCGPTHVVVCPVFNMGPKIFRCIDSQPADSSAGVSDMPAFLPRSGDPGNLALVNISEWRLSLVLRNDGILQVTSL